jgi:hypothetical protein
MRTLRRRILLACALALVASLVCVTSATADIEPTNNRFTGAEGPLVGGVAVSGNISASGDEDWYYLYVGSTGDFTITTNAYTVAYKYDAGGLDELFYFNTSGGSTIEQWQPGLYYFRVYKNSAPKAYTLSVTGPTSSQPPSLANTHRTATLLNEIYEPADTGYRQAQLLTPYAENQATIGASGDADWYKFYVTSTCDVSVGLWTPHDLSLDVYSDPTKSELVWMRGPSSTWNRQLARGIYYVKVHEGTAPQEYTFSVQGQFVSLDAPTSMTTPKVVGKATSRSKTKFTGSVKPGRAALVNVEISRLSKKKFKAFKVLHASAVANGAWSIKAKLSKGTYRIRTTTRATPGYTAGSSSWRKVVVK